MSPTLSEKCQFHIIPPTGGQGPSVSCDARPSKNDEQEDMETGRGEGQLSVTINVHVGEWTCAVDPGQCDQCYYETCSYIHVTI